MWIVTVSTCTTYSDKWTRLSSQTEFCLCLYVPTEFSEIMYKYAMELQTILFSIAVTLFKSINLMFPITIHKICDCPLRTK